MSKRLSDSVGRRWNRQLGCRDESRMAKPTAVPEPPQNQPPRSVGCPAGASRRPAAGKPIWESPTRPFRGPSKVNLPRYFPTSAKEQG